MLWLSRGYAEQARQPHEARSRSSFMRPGSVYRLHCQHQGIDCRCQISAGYKFQKFSVLALQRSAIRCNDPGAPFSGLLLERSDLKPLVLHSSTGLRLPSGTQR
jgi:hypothetical protein